MTFPNRSHTVLHAAWIAAGRPIPPYDFGPGYACSRCGAEHEPTTNAWKSVISPVFTAYDDWRDTAMPLRLCIACTWAFRTIGLRDHAHLVDLDDAPRLTRLTSGELGDLLAAGPLDGSRAAWVPLRRNRKHCITHCQWGLIAVDDVPLMWSSDDAERLLVMRRLREWGFGPRQLSSPCPHFGVLNRHEPARRQEILTLWPQLDGWRRRRPWLDLALRATVVDEDPSPAVDISTDPGGTDHAE
ncbi:hypothetical protein [Embleya scabrispora]|uniref:hypothetical protein n=1 Tax=Embleya scabrispora TaxID=159449 RepID=UPI001913A79C|nr:hypothetical protein [Embleya scabrispora]